jgi:ABC-type Mn2+/Zn2+ transport system ATPase subunit
LDLKTIESAEKVLNYFGINAKIINNELVVNEYHQPEQMTGFWGAYHVPDYTFSDLGIDENKLFKYIHKIYHDANFKYSNASDLGNLKEIGGNAYFNYSSVLKADKLELIYGDANFRNSKVKSLKNLMEIGKNADLSAVKEASIQSDVKGYIDSLPDGFDTPLTRYFEDSGTELSVGQWQKLAVARAFYSDSDIIILDEPTASLDALAEQEIFRQFDILRKDKTTLFVSHRLSSAVDADRIVVVKHGKVIEDGTHSQLMEQNGEYARMFEAQAKKYRTKNN